MEYGNDGFEVKGGPETICIANTFDSLNLPSYIQFIVCYDEGGGEGGLIKMIFRCGTTDL